MARVAGSREKMAMRRIEVAEAWQGPRCSRRCWPARARCPSRRPGREPADRRLVTQAEKLSRDGDHRGAAQAYEQAAAQAPGELRDRFLLRAAREYVRADQIDQAGALLKQVSTTLPTADFALRAAVAAEINLQTQTSRKSIGGARSHSAAVAARRRFRPAGAARAGAVRDEPSRRGHHDGAGARARSE